MAYSISASFTRVSATSRVSGWLADGPSRSIISDEPRARMLNVAASSWSRYAEVAGTAACAMMRLYEYQSRTCAQGPPRRHTHPMSRDQRPPRNAQAPDEQRAETTQKRAGIRRAESREQSGARDGCRLR